VSGIFLEKIMAITISQSTVPDYITEIIWKWTSDASGDYSETTTEFITGTVDNFIAIPGSGGDQPTDLYDVVVTDKHGSTSDVILTQGANLSNSTTKRSVNTIGKFPAVNHSQLTLTVANAGNAKKGTFILILKC
jgi:hypothetical protein